MNRSDRPKRRGLRPWSRPIASAALLLALCAGGCSATAVARIALAGKPGATDPSRVRIHSVGVTGRAYVPIGVLTVAHDGPDCDDAVEVLREEAAALGADAIVELDLQYVAGGFTIACRADGVAVTYR